MVGAGSQSLVAIVVATADGAVPCGACLQVIAEFAVGRDIPVLLVDEQGNVRETKMGALLPDAFTSGKRNE
jgi:cytidine deaminase